VVDGRAHVVVVAEGLGHRGRLRNTFRWFLADDGRPWFVALCATTAVPADVRRAELEGPARSWRAIAVEAPRRRPWWKLW
jgi:hypothetical protein